MNGKVRTDFDTSPIMSTYLNAFLISDLAFKEFNSTNEYPIGQRAFATKEDVKHTTYALSLAANTLKVLHQYFDIPYELEKLDHVAVPNIDCDGKKQFSFHLRDFCKLSEIKNIAVFIAMENWGLVTYSKVNMIYDPDEDTAERQLNVTEAITHELSHQWLGNLVTHKWWSQLWLTEGINTFFQMMTIDLVIAFIFHVELFFGSSEIT